MMQPDKYRIDRAYGKIYQYDNSAKAYLFYCSFYAAGVSAKDSDEKIIEKIQMQ